MPSKMIRTDKWPLQATLQQRQLMQDTRDEYRAFCRAFDADFTTASLKLWDGKEWLWHNVAIKAVRQRHLLGTVKSPALVFNRHCHLAVPVEITPERLPDQQRVCAVDVGINTLATASIVSSNGTVAARRFFHPAADMDRRDKRAAMIRGKARKTGKLSKGFLITHMAQPSSGTGTASAAFLPPPRESAGSWP